MFKIVDLALLGAILLLALEELSFGIVVESFELVISLALVLKLFETLLDHIVVVLLHLELACQVGHALLSFSLLVFI